MSTRDAPEYVASDYQTARPRYKDSVVDTILAYHSRNNPGAGYDLAVDIGTGTGIFARQLPDHFSRVIGTDISADMLQSARDATPDGSVEYVEAPSEDLSFLQDKSVDMITVATAAHWFDLEKFVKEAERVLTPNGTLAMFSYTGFIHNVDYPQCNRIMKKWLQQDEKSGGTMGNRYNNLRDGYRKYHRIFARDSWTDIERRITYDSFDGEPSSEYPPVMDPYLDMVEFTNTWRNIENYWKTASSMVRFRKQNPGRQTPIGEAIREMKAASGVDDMDVDMAAEWEQVLLMSHPPSIQ
ncbi:hypothetical protein GGF46_003677 [Coemansia sp. RSA 552]|nr:hypothetical protein GGF46_003677 [Coemansia sp. RSA 552]